MKVFISASWQTQSQRNRINNIKTLLTNNGHTFYSPAQDNIFNFSTESQAAHDYHFDQLKGCDFLLAFADDLIGRMTLEIGYAYAKNIPIILASQSSVSNINLFLSKTTSCVVESTAQLIEVLDGTSQFQVYHYTGTTQEN